MSLNWTVFSNATTSFSRDRLVLFLRTVHFEHQLTFSFQKREDPVFETYKKVKATEESLNEEFRSGFIILPFQMTSAWPLEVI